MNIGYSVGLDLTPLACFGASTRRPLLPGGCKETCIPTATKASPSWQ